TKDSGKWQETFTCLSLATCLRYVSDRFRVSGSARASSAATRKPRALIQKAELSPRRAAIAPMANGAPALRARPKLYVNPMAEARNEVGNNSAVIMPKPVKCP